MARHPAVLAWTILALLMAASFTLLGLELGERPSALQFFAENGPIETVECLFLAIAIVPFSLAAINLTRGHALTCIGVMVVIALMIVRETPRCGSIYSTADACLPASGKLVAYILIAVVLTLMLVAKRFVPMRKSAYLVISEHRWIWPVVWVVAILGGAQLAEHLHEVGVEEMLELCAYLYLALIGLWVLRHSCQLTDAPAPIRRGICR